VTDALFGRRQSALDARAFEALIDRLEADRERAADEYVLLHRKLVRFFSHRAAVNPEGLADETLDRVARRMAEGESVDHPGRYAQGVARRVWQECWRARPVTSLESEAHAASAGFSDVEDSKEVLDRCLTECLEALAPESRALILRYYAGERRARIANRSALAAELGLSPNSLRIRVCRLKEALATEIRRRIGGGGPAMKQSEGAEHDKWGVAP
jgi:hypothetical protein